MMVKQICKKTGAVLLLVNAVFWIALNNGTESKEPYRVTAAFAELFPGFRS